MVKLEKNVCLAKETILVLPGCTYTSGGTMWDLSRQHFSCAVRGCKRALTPRSPRLSL